jgi:hypothetical protein
MEHSGVVSLVANGPKGEAALQQFLEVLAMDAIAAMREPTEALAEVMNAHASNGMVDWRDLHTAMLDEALK